MLKSEKVYVEFLEIVNSTINSKIFSHIIVYFNKIIKNRYFIYFAYLILFLIFSYIFYLRFPNNFQEPNFYGEDGYVYANNLINKGFWNSLFTTFNGYYIWGLYIFEKIGFIINSLIFNGEFVNLPRSFALVSYGFLGFCVLLPIILFRKLLRLSGVLILVLFVLFVPLIGWDYAVIGTIGNLKFAFAYIAFLLIVYRHTLPVKSKKFYIVDLAVILCAYTNVTVYVLLPFALVRYFNKIRKLELKKLLNDNSFKNLILVSVFLLPQVYVVHKYGVPSISGYLDNPYNMNSTIEIFLSRSYLYGLIFPVYKHMNDIRVIIASFLLLFYFLKYCKRNYFALAFGIYSIFVATFLFAIKRTGISDFFIGYLSGGPDQFFYAQNWIFGFIFALALASMLKNKNYKFSIIYLLMLISMAFIIVPKSGTYGKNNFMQNSVGNIYSVAKADCMNKRSGTINLTIYPSSDQHFRNIQYSKLCTSSALNYEPKYVDLGLNPFNNNYLDRLGYPHFFTQTFTSSRNSLNGVSIYFSTFNQSIKTPYVFELFDKDCKSKIYSEIIPYKKIKDNTYTLIQFPVINNSQNISYCYSVNSSLGIGKINSPLAIQLSKPNIYENGRTNINGSVVDTDVVFKLHYK